jgi:hypothetical protein
VPVPLPEPVALDDGVPVALADPLPVPLGERVALTATTTLALPAAARRYDADRSASGTARSSRRVDASAHPAGGASHKARTLTPALKAWLRYTCVTLPTKKQLGSTGHSVNVYASHAGTSQHARAQSRSVPTDAAPSAASPMTSVRAWYVYCSNVQ